MHWIVDESIPVTDRLAKLPEDVKETWEVFDTLKDERFGSAADRADPNAEAILAAREMVFRYAFFGDQRGRPRCQIAHL